MERLSANQMQEPVIPRTDVVCWGVDSEMKGTP